MEGFPALAFKGAQASLAAAQYGPVWRKFFQAAVPHTGAFFRLQDVHHMEVSAAQGMGAGVLRFHDRNAGKAKKSPDGLLLLRIIPGGAGIVPDKAGQLCAVFWRWDPRSTDILPGCLLYTSPSPRDTR